MNFDSLTIQRKLFATFGLTLFLLIASAGSATLLLRRMSDETHRLAGASADKLFQGGQIVRNAVEMQSLQRGVIIRTQAGDTGKAELFLANYVESDVNLRKEIATMRADGLAAAGAALVDGVELELDNSEPAFRRFAEAIRAKQVGVALEINMKELMPSLQKVDEKATVVLVHQQEIMLKSGTDAEGLVHAGQWIMGIALLLALGCGALVVMVIQRLDAQLRKTVAELTGGFDQVSNAAEQVSTASQSLAREATAQTAMIEETAASADEINSMAKRNVASSQTAQGLGVEAMASTEESNRAVTDCVHAMDAIGDSSNKIAKTLQVIDKIAFQTNILALNAAVEAARAGEAGMGFAVVAEEVRSLAQRCAEAAQETSALVETSLENSNAGRAKIEVLVATGEKVNSVFARIKVLVDEVYESSQEQGKGIDQIGRAIQKMEQGTQQSAAGAEEGAAAAEELNAQSAVLRQAAGALARMVGLPDERQSKTMRLGARHAGGMRPSGSGGRQGAKLQPKLVAAKVNKPAAVMAGAGEFPMDEDFREF